MISTLVRLGHYSHAGAWELWALNTSKGFIVPTFQRGHAALTFQRPNLKRHHADRLLERLRFAKKVHKVDREY